MNKLLFCLLLLVLLFPGAAFAETTVSVMSYGAVADGVTNNWYAFAHALNALEADGGGKLSVPAGNYLIDTTFSPLTIPASVQIVGSLNKTNILISCQDAPTNYHALWQNGGNNIQVNYISFTKVADFNLVMFPVNSYSSYDWNSDYINGGVTASSKYYSYIFELGVQSGASAGFDLYECGIQKATYGLFEPSTSKTSITGSSVTHTTFQHDISDDLEFNSPSGVLTGLNVSHNTFISGGEFAVGLANVQNATLVGNKFTGYNFEAIHIEDRSSDVTIAGNTLTSCGLAKDSYIQVINNSTNINIVSNTFNAASNTNVINLINIEPGGNFTAPSNVSVGNNTLTLATEQNGIDFADIPSGVSVTGNTISAIITTTGASQKNIGIELFHCPNALDGDNIFNGLTIGLLIDNN